MGLLRHTLWGLIWLFPTLGFAFSVGTLNLYHYTHDLPQRTANLEKELSTRGTPDIMGFQEAARWIGKRLPYDHFIQRTGYQGIYEATNKFGVMNEGLALVARGPAEKLKTVYLPATKRISRQAMNIGIFNTPDSGPVVIANVHLSPFPDGSWRREAQVRFMLDTLKEFSQFPIVIIGDLNDGYESRSLQILREAGFTDIWDGRGETYDPRSNPLLRDSPYPPARLDYILYQKSKLKLVRSDWMCRENWVSDHFGLKAEFRRR